VRLRFGQTELARLNLRSFKSLRTYVNAEQEILIATLDFGQGDETLGLMLKPRMWLGFGNFQRIPPSP
jgi:hypothetical protein